MTDDVGIGVGPHPEPWPDDPRLDPKLLSPPRIDRTAPVSTLAHDHALHAAFESETWEIEDGLDEASLRARLRDAGAVRAKGFIRMRDGVFAVQGVGRRLELTPAPAVDPALVGRLVVIRAS